MKRRILWIWVLMCLFINILAVSPAFAVTTIWDGHIADGFSGGSGTKDDPYQVETASQLAYFAHEVNSGRSFEGEYIKLISDIVLNDTSNWEHWATTAPNNIWIPIGQDNKHLFKGIFDGNSQTISGIYINSENDGKGLFGFSSGSISNLNVNSSYIHGHFYVGGILASGDHSSITDCTFSGIVNGSSAGGIVGSGGTVERCYNFGSISGDFSIGGIMGGAYVDASQHYQDCFYIFDCKNFGNITGLRYVGGIAGAADYISRCENSGNIEMKGDWVEPGGAIGGIVGRLMLGNVVDCQNTGVIKGESSVGGIIGGIEDWSGLKNHESIVFGCNNSGRIFGVIEGGGGIVGCDAHMENESTTIECCFNTGSIDGMQSVGGIIGRGNTGALIIQKCYNAGVIAPEGDAWLGGICGAGYDCAKIYNCYNIGDVSSGIACDAIIIENCYNVGFTYGGGAICSSAYQINHCYYLDSCIKFDSNAKGISLSQEQMQQQSSFEGFDFSDIWKIDPNVNDGYPYLQEIPPIVTDEPETPPAPAAVTITPAEPPVEISSNKNKAAMTFRWVLSVPENAEAVENLGAYIIPFELWKNENAITKDVKVSKPKIKDGQIITAELSNIPAEAWGVTIYAVPYLNGEIVEEAAISRTVNGG